MSSCFISQRSLLIQLFLFAAGGYLPYEGATAIGIDLKLYLNLTQSQFMMVFYSTCSIAAMCGAITHGLYWGSTTTNAQSGVIFTILMFLSQVALTVGLSIKSPLIVGMSRFFYGYSLAVHVIVVTIYCDKYATSSAVWGIVRTFQQLGGITGLYSLPFLLCNFYPAAPSCHAGIPAGMNQTATNQGAISDGNHGGNFRYALVITGSVITAFIFAEVIISATMMAVEKKLDSRKETSNLHKSALPTIGEELAPEKSKITKIVSKLKPRVWIAIFMYVVFFSALFAMTVVVPDYAKQHLHMSKGAAASLGSIVFFMMIMAPLLGAIIDRSNISKTKWLLVSCLIMTVGQLIWGRALLFLSPTDSTAHYLVAVVLVINGMCYAIFDTIACPWLATLVPEHAITGLFGLTFGMQEGFGGLVMYGTGIVVDKVGWTYFPFIIAALFFIATVLGCGFYYCSNTLDNNLHDDHDDDCID